MMTATSGLPPSGFDGFDSARDFAGMGRLYEALCLFRVEHADGSVASEQEVDGEVCEGECGAERARRAFEALHLAFVAVDTAFETREAAGLSVAEEFFHLRFEDGEVREDGC